jgi:signal transduction histidine kinase
MAYPLRRDVPYGCPVSSDVASAPPGGSGEQPADDWPWRGGPPWRDGRRSGRRASGRRASGRGAQHGSVIFAIVILFIQLAGAHFAQHHQTATQLDHLGYSLLIVSALALPFRLRWRMTAFTITIAATITYVVLGFPYGPIFLAALVSIFGAIRTGHRRFVWTALGISYAVFLGTGRIFQTIGPYTLRQPGWVMSIQIAVWIVLAIAIAEGIRVRTAHFSEVRRTMAEQARARAEQERRQASEERLRIAQELHDVLGHHLSLINVQAGVGLHLMDDNPDQARAALEAIKQASTEALGEVRAVLAALRPKDEKAPRTPAPILANLDTLIDPASAAVIGSPRPLPPDVDRAAYRIIQESLTNVRRHAGDNATASVTITYGPDSLGLRISDDGRTVPPSEESNRGDGTGIAGMRTRAEALGGTFTAGPRPSGGFVVTASLPIPTESQ